MPCCSLPSRSGTAIVDVSHHGKGESIIVSPHLLNVGMLHGNINYLAVPKRISEDAQSIFLRDVCSIPDPLLDAYHDDTITLSGNDAQHMVLPLTHPAIVSWLDGSSGYFAVYRQHGLWITKVNEVGNGNCVKQNVAARLHTADGEVFVGTNRCHNPQTECPREVQGMRSGEGYHLCIEVCQQPAHAEVDAIRQAGEKARGSIIYLAGHTYACGNCQEAAKAVGATIKIDPSLF
jgi:hypothetical protein